MLRLAAIVLLVGSGAACAPRIDAGAPCERSSECESPLVCLLGRCRVQCLEDRDCLLRDATCVVAEGGLGVCTTGDENDCTAEVCPAPLTCMGSQCRAPCAGDGDCLASQRCTGAVCLPRDGLDAGGLDAGGPDAGGLDAGGLDAGGLATPRLCASEAECRPGEVCTSNFPPAVCTPACDEHADCALPSVCDEQAAEVDGGFILGCSTVCRPGTGEGCPPGTSCRMVARGTAVFPEGPPSLTLCSASRAAGTDGCACENLDSSSECAPGLSCEQPDEGRMCLPICVVGTECRPGVLCEMTFRSVVVDGMQYGVCPPAVSAPLACD